MLNETDERSDTSVRCPPLVWIATEVGSRDPGYLHLRIVTPMCRRHTHRQGHPPTVPPACALITRSVAVYYRDSLGSPCMDTAAVAAGGAQW